MITLDMKTIIGNILGCSELDERMLVTDDLVRQYIIGLEETMPDVYVEDSWPDGISFSCESSYGSECTYDSVKQGFRKRVGGKIDLDTVNTRLDILSVVFLESYTNWFVAVHFKKDACSFLEYVRRAFSSVSSMMDCIR